MTFLAIYLAGVACALLWGEYQLRNRIGTRGEQLVYSLGWPFPIACILGMLVSGFLSDLAEAFDRRFA